MSRSKAIEELQRQAKQIPEYIEILSKIAEFGTASKTEVDSDTARSIILISHGLLEYALAVAIGSKFNLYNETIKRKIFDGDHEREGVMSTMYTRNLFAHALDIYGENTHTGTSTQSGLSEIIALTPKATSIFHQKR